MRRLRFSIIIFLIVIGIFLNIERLDIGTQMDAINIQTFVYFLAAVAVFSAICLPEFWRPPTWFLTGWWLAVYLLVKGLFFTGRPMLGGIYTYITFTEIALIVLLVITSYNVGQEIVNIEQTIANVTLDDVSERVKRLDRADYEISQEFARSRRNDTPLSIMVLKVNPENVEFNLDRTSEDILQGMLNRYASNKLVCILDRDLRRTDLVLEMQKENQVVLVLPETNEIQMGLLAERVQSIAYDQLGTMVSSGYASFPQDALTFDALIHQAESRLSDSKLGIVSKTDHDGTED